MRGNIEGLLKHLRASLVEMSHLYLEKNQTFQRDANAILTKFAEDAEKHHEPCPPLDNSPTANLKRA